MTLDRLGSWRLPVIALASLVVALVVVGLILLLGQTPGPPDGTPSTKPTTESTPSASDESTPESAVRAFFDAFVEARESADPDLIEPLVNGTDSSAYQTAAGFLLGQREVGKGSITTVQELSEFDVTVTGSRAIVEFTYLAGGYDIALETGEPLESPSVLDPSRVRAEVVRIDGEWLLDSYEESNP